MVLNLGHSVLILALVSALFSIVTSIAGARAKREDLVQAGTNALYCVTLLVTVAVVLLWRDIVSHDFSNEYVASYSNRDMPKFYVLASLWGGQKGSLLFWGWLLTIYAALAVYIHRDKYREFMPYVIASLMVSAAFFITLNIFVSPPFERLWQVGERVVTAVIQPTNSLSFAPADGRGLNPLLQHPAMAIHPPILYLGFVGFAVPFAFAIAALFTGRLDNQWLMTIRRWTLVPWFFLGIGMLLGGKWAYMELGWGGYWAWDPVENAALMPWLLATAYIHSVMIQEKKNMLRVWNMALILGTYVLCIFGTFITRSGVISSVHSFARSDIAPWFVGYLILLIAAPLLLILKRLPLLRNKNQFESVVSRESAFLINNLLFLGALAAVFWGTVFPMVYEAVYNEKATMAAPWFNPRMVPIGLFLLLLTGIGPLVAWRKTSWNLLRKIFMKPLGLALVGLGIMLVVGIRHVYALISLTLSIFVTATIIAEFHRGARARMRTNSEGYFPAVYNLLMKNKRRYGGYIVHFGIVVMFVGFTGKAFEVEKDAHLKIGESSQIRGYSLTYLDMQTIEDGNKIVWQAKMDVYVDGEKVKTIYPNKHFYKVQEQPTTEVVLRSTLKEDLYVVLAQPNDDQSAIFKIYINPLVNLVWGAGLIVTLGTIIILLPADKERLKKTQVSSTKLKRAAEVT